VPSLPPIDPAMSVALGGYLRDARVRAGLSQEAVAHRAGISRNQVQLIEAGLSSRADGGKPWNPHLSTLVAVCAALDVPVGPLVDYALGLRAEVVVEIGDEERGTEPRAPRERRADGAETEAEPARS
jgi:transcriptional regulator with XRE-family HTH domain